MRNNPRIASLFAGLAAAGVQHRCNWQTRRDGKKGAPDVEHLSFVGDGFAPSISTAVLIDYDGDGYGLYLESPSASILDDVVAISKPRATADATKGGLLGTLRDLAEWSWPDTGKGSRIYHAAQDAVAKAEAIQTKLAAFAEAGSDDEEMNIMADIRALLAG